MKRIVRKRKPASAARDLNELHPALIDLYDNLTETAAWTALVLDGNCGVLAGPSSEVDPDTRTGLLFAAIWLKRRNKEHTAALRSICNRLRAIRAAN